MRGVCATVAVAKYTRSRRVWSTMLVVLTFWTWVAGSSAQDRSAENILAAMREFDDTILNDVQMDLQIVWAKSNFNDLDSEHPIYNVRIAHDGDTWVYRSELSGGIDPPAYIEPAPFRRGAPVPKGQTVVSRAFTNMLFSVSDFHGRRFVDQVFVIASDGTIVQELKSKDQVHIAKPGIPLGDRYFYIPVLSSGRGFSHFLDEIIDSEVTGDGLLRCTAVGTYPNPLRTTPSRWVLTIEIDNGFLVRSAQALTLDGDVIAEFRNDGTLQSEKGLIAKSAQFRMGDEEFVRAYYYEDGYTNIAFVALSHGADQQLISTVRDALLGGYPVGTQVIDESQGDPPLTYDVGSDPIRDENGLGATLGQTETGLQEAPVENKRVAAGQESPAVEATPVPTQDDGRRGWTMLTMSVGAGLVLLVVVIAMNKKGTA